MKKREMINEIFNAVKWTNETVKTNEINRAMRCSLDTVKGVYNAFVKDNRMHPNFYAAILYR